MGKNKFNRIWVWCGLCNKAVLFCEKCQNTSCNGGGCKSCDEDFKYIKKINKKDFPSREDISVLKIKFKNKNNGAIVQR